MMPLPILLLAISGLIAGCLVWWTARWFGVRYRLQSQKVISSADGVWRRAAIVIIAMTLWGAYIGAKAPSLALAASALVVTAILLCVALVDFQVRRIPDALVVALLVWAAVQFVWLDQSTPLAIIAGMLIAGGLFLVLRIVSRGQMGMGDVKLEAALGALLGFPAIMTAMLLGVIIGGLAAIALLVSKRAGRKDPFAYGPYLVLGAWIVLVRVWGLWPG